VLSIWKGWRIGWLRLIANNNVSLGLDLYQTPTYVTRDALKLYRTGNNSKAAAKHALEVYRQYLIDGRVYDIGLDDHINQIENFLGVMPGARFDGW
jgi:hypothetical protein